MKPSVLPWQNYLPWQQIISTKVGTRKLLIWNLLQDNAFSHQIPLLLIPFLGSNLLHDCYPQPWKAVLCSKWAACADRHHSHGLLCAGAQQSCMTGAGSSGVARARREGRTGVTSLRSPALHNAADKSWQGLVQRGPTAVQPPEPAQHAEGTLGTCVSHHFSQPQAALHSGVLKAGWPTQWVLGAIHSSLNCIIL